MGAWTRGPVPHLRRARAPARRARRSSSPATLLRERRRAARRRRLPDDAADAPVGARRPPAWASTSRPTPPTPRPPRDFHGVAVTYARVAAVGRALGAPVLAGHARHRRRGPPPRRGARAGATGFAPRLRRPPRAGCCCRARRSAPTPRRSRACATTTASSSRRHLHLRRRRPRRHLPPGHVHPLRRRAAVAQRRRRGRGVVRRRARRPRGGAPLPDRDLRRPRRTACRGSSRRRTRSSRSVRAGGHRDAGGLVVAADGAHARAIAAILKAVTGRAPTVVLHTEARAAEKLAAFTRSHRALDRRGEHGQRGRRHPAPARRRLRDGGEDAADLPPDRRALRAHDARPARPT